jgi:L-amino acid N-acyltransferase YncA
MTAASLPCSLRPFGQHDREADYQLLLRLANAQVPQDPRGNEEWLQHRRAYDERRGQRRHYIAVHLATQEPIGYAALEQQQADPGSFRIYLVFDPQRWSFELVGTLLYQQLLRDAEALQAAKLVCIEYATDAAFRAFLERHDFRYVGDGTYNGFTIVRYEKMLLGAGQE